MSKWIKPSRVSDSMANLFAWRHHAKSQAAKHLFPLLALIEHGVNTRNPVRFTEQDDKIFWDKYCRLAGDDREPGGSKPFAQNYYIEPLDQELKPSDYPHRGPSTVRDRTFRNSWRAADYSPTNEEWLLRQDYASIFAEKVLIRGEATARIPVVDLAAFLYRYDPFDDDADALTIADRFRSDFPFDDSAYRLLFEYTDEPAEAIFTPLKPTNDEVNNAIREMTVSRTAALPISTTISGKSAIDDDDVHLVDVYKLLKLGSSGIIFRGCPGTSKTWYAKQIASKLVADPSNDIFQIQFHPSYGYEDFVEGYRPDENKKSGFAIVNGRFLDAVGRADSTNSPVVFIIDEINRGDPARAFGELLTYIEHGYRGIEFPTALSGNSIRIPSNLIVFGTMNQYDRSTVQFDMALVRRFDHVDLKPDVELVERFITNAEDNETEFTTEQVDLISHWFSSLQQMVEHGGIGHTYFRHVKSIEDLRTIWDYRMFPYCENVLELDPARLGHVRNSFEALILNLRGSQGNREE